MAKTQWPVMGGLTALVGLAVAAFFLYAFGLRPLVASLPARRWNPVPCVVERAELKEHSSDDPEDGTTYSVDVAYSYSVGGIEHHGARYSFLDSSNDLDVEGKRATAARLKAQPQQLCWVDPGDPRSAVLVRDLPREVWLVLGLGGLLGIVAPLVLGVGTRYSQWRRRRECGRALALIGEQSPSTELSGALVDLELPGGGGIGLKILVLLGLTLWAAADWPYPVWPILIGSAFLLSLVRGLRRRRTWGLQLFTSADGVNPGGTIVLVWMLKSGARAPSRLKLGLCGTESADSDEATAAKAVFEQTLVDEDTHLGPASGYLSTEIPRELMPGRGKSIRWTIVAAVDDRTLKFPLPVEPSFGRL
jgi:hypothetical protein